MLKKILLKIILQSLIILSFACIGGLFLNYIRPDSLSIGGNGDQNNAVIIGLEKETVISLKNAKKAFEQNKGLFIDARAEHEYQNGHIAGAINLPWEKFDFFFQKVVNFIHDDSIIIVYCDGEYCSLSKDVANTLIDFGYSNVKVLINGWSLWNANNLPVGGNNL